MPIPRKILVRVVGAPLLLAALGAILWWDDSRHSTLGLRGLLFAVCLVACLEFHGFCRAKGIATAHIVGSVAAALAPILVGLRTADGPLAWPPVALAGVLALYVLLKTVFRFGTFLPEGAALTLLGSVYVGMIALVLTPPSANIDILWYLVFLVATSKGSDMAAYVAGKSIGRHKFAAVSPNKTWEGTIAGAVVGTALGVWILRAKLTGGYCQVPLPALMLFSLLVTMAGQVGDLVKSAFKRWAGVKDSGSLLPEFGGMLDMCDSFLLAVPVCHGTSLILFALFKGA
ncbi:MAG TPA: phosphatidate cytidylyltransferase [Planctomycetota bacterium]